MNKDDEKCIDTAAKRAAREVVNLQRRKLNLNLYRTTERLLRQYKRHRRMIDNPEEFEFFPIGKSKDISIAPPAGSGVIDKIDLAEAFVSARKRAYEAMLTNWLMVDMAIRQFETREEFVVIRMYYFNEDIWGRDRGDEERYTWDEIAEELARIGVGKGVLTLQRWRSRMVQDMTTLIFGVDGAVSIEARQPKQEDGHES